MEKFRTFLKRTGALMSALVILLCCAVPVSAEVVSPEAIDFTSWIGTAVGGFLDFHLWPGMSLSEILWVCFIIGILFWFLKMTA